MTQLQTCSHWEEMIAARHPQDLTPTERASLHAHLATCASCAGTALAYERMQQSIRALPPVQPLLVLPVPLGQQKRSLFAFRGLLNITQHSNHRERSAFASPAFRSPLRTAIATALVLLVIFVSVSATSLYLRSGNFGVSTRHPSTSPVPTKIPAMPFPTFTTPFVSYKPTCPLDVSPVLHYVCVNKLYQTIEQKQVKGDFTVVLQAAYADANRISIAYQLLKKEKDGTISQGLEGENSLDGGYITLTEQSGTVLKGQGSSGVMNSRSGKMNRVEFFQAPTLVGTGSKQINVRLHFDGIIEGVNMGANLLAPSAPFNFNFKLSINPTLRVINIHQTTIVKGISTTIETASITNTSIALRLTFDVKISTPQVVALKIAGVKINDCVSEGFGVNGLMYVDCNGPLLNRKGLWILSMGQIIQEQEGRFAPYIDTTDVWNFQFMVK